MGLAAPPTSGRQRLCIALRAGEELRIGSAVVRSKGDVSLRVEADAATGVLFGSQILHPAPGDGHLRRLYLTIQEALTGHSPDGSPARGSRLPVHRIAEHLERMEELGNRMPDGLQAILELVRADRLQEALRPLADLIARLEAAPRGAEGIGTAVGWV